MASRIQIQRLKVLTRTGQTAYDECFHKGINIIRGENSSGKSTITHLLFFGLGGSYSDFVIEAKQCQNVYTQVDINGCVITLKRELRLSENGRIDSMVGLTIFWGTIDEALANSCESNYFGYRTTDKKKSFSNVLFEIMDMPLVVGDNNITMHQILRLMYIDQESPTSSLFMYEQFDNQITRETVAELLMGIYDSDLYISKLNIKDYQKQLDNVNTEIKIIKASLNRPEECSSSFLINIIKNKEAEVIRLSESIIKKRAGQKVKTKYSKNFDRLKESVVKLRLAYSQHLERQNYLQSEIDDTEMFIVALENRQKALADSISVRKGLEGLILDFCPECLTKLDNDVEEGHCRLCKAPIDNTKGIRQAKRYELELSFQIKESKIVLDQLKKDLVKANSIISGTKSQLETYERLLTQELKSTLSPQDEEIDEMIYNKGLIEGEILQYRTMLERASYYEGLVEKREQLQTLIAKEACFIKAKEAEQQKNKAIVENKIKEFGIYFLQNDLQRQQEFTQADEFNVDFSNNIVYLSNKHSKYSASSNFYLKIVARFALFMASLEIPFMRFPHFIFADNMEDKGIEIERAQNFQKVLIDKLSEYDINNYQVIYTTSYITEALDKSPYVVGERYTKDNKSLKYVD
ncbi:AAA family ATPase [Alistipes shahii]|uniref:AAA family ATPase n=1 Tax=Alistipes shahii TaxID=328814 RepID=UPI0014591D95|nr:AAA family ATPase [Alistipes shahii]NMF22390.1 hypothetical protein [Alistipes shahii]